MLGSVGWQQWFKFGQVQFGIDDDTGLQRNSTVSPLLPVAWRLRFSVGYQ